MLGKKAVVVIPARYDSQRFPGKLLKDLQGKPVIQWVYEKAAASIADDVLIATDSEEIYKAAEEFSAKAVMTSPDHPSGTDRVWEAVEKLEADIVVNVQGDEPFIPPGEINNLINLLKNDSVVEMATIAVPAIREEVANNPNTVKVLKDKNNYALYFSRSMIPYLREDGGEETRVFVHWGIYGWQKHILEKIVKLPQSPLEKCEKLEQLRALENGIKIYVIESNFNSIGIDVPEDFERAKEYLRNSSE